MNDNTIDLGRTDDEVLTSEVSDEVRLLLREFSHRINNEFTSAIGVISIAARSANDEAKVALAAVEDRLQNYALVHHALRMPEHTTRIDAAACLRQLCRAISRSKLESKGIELRFVERTFQMNSERCWRLGLIVSELITNSERHAFGNGGGSTRVELLPSLSFVECRVTGSGTGSKYLSRVRTQDCRSACKEPRRHDRPTLRTARRNGGPDFPA
jgi:two-component sensor histidine kinase